MIKCCLDCKHNNNQCCCNCKYHFPDYEHCLTNESHRKDNGSCICLVQKGWVCFNPEMGGRVYSGWSEHGLCEGWNGNGWEDKCRL